MEGRVRREVRVDMMWRSCCDWAFTAIARGGGGVVLAIMKEGSNELGFDGAWELLA